MTTPITVQSSQPGETISVIVSGVGDRGPQGAQGPQGSTGPVGPRGIAGKGNDTVFLFKPADQEVEDSSTLDDDDDLQFEAEADSTYLVTMAWVFDEEVGRSKWSIGLPSGASIVQALHQFAGPDDYKPEYHFPEAPNLPELVLPFTPETDESNDGVNTLIAVIETGETAGTVAFRFAQVTATSTDKVAKVKAGSWLRAELVVPDPAAAPEAPATAGVNVAAPDANVTLTTTSKRYQFLAPTASINVTLPSVTAENEGLSFIIKNEDSSFEHTVTVKDASNATVTSVLAPVAVEVVCTGSGWKFITLGGG